jgi:hypothetical protein
MPEGGRPAEILPAASCGVRCDAAALYVHARPPGGQSWIVAIPWTDITRVGFEARGYAASDGIHLCTADRPSGFRVPIEAEGGQALWAELLHRGLFDAGLAVQALRAWQGFFWWPGPPPAERDRMASRPRGARLGLGKRVLAAAGRGAAGRPKRRAGRMRVRARRGH